MSERLEPVIGLEIHAQLLTRSKMYCGCSAAYSAAPPNTFVCAVCGGMPGALPTINRAAVDYALAVALALNCSIPARSKFDRKNYSYPDLPKGYQISQYDMPLGVDGWIDLNTGDGASRCGIVRVHLEEDTGKSMHVAQDGRDVSLVDYNRSGVPLLEIVSAPDIRAPEEARQYFSTIRQVLMYLGVNDGNLQEGSMRADVNVSLRHSGEPVPSTKVEIKNLNSFRAVQRAIEYEIERQTRLITQGQTVPQETRGWQEDRNATVPQRSKEYAQDYRYFPEPDLPPLAISAEHVEKIAASLPEFASARADRFTRAHALSASVAGILTEEKSLADFFEAAVSARPNVAATAIANWVSGELLHLLKEARQSVEQSRLRPEALAHLVGLVESGMISNTAGKTVLHEVFATGDDPDAVVERLHLAQVSDPRILETLTDQALDANPGLVEAYRKGKTNVMNALAGQVMKASEGRANMTRVRELLEERLGTTTQS
ncbi:MAG: Asp-tRNA(Asn)/Glu-tRNA(Gln) amidotransferase subunit GatB [Chloroflexota bacterium]